MLQRVVLVATLLVATAPQAWGQIDLGGFLRNEFRRGAQEIEGEIRGVIREATQEWRRPGPPVLPSPIPRQPEIYPPLPEILPPGEVIITPPAPIVRRVIVAETVEPSKEMETETTDSEEMLPEVAVGQMVSLDGPGFGEEPGAVYLIIGELVLYADLVEWTDEQVAAALPALPMINAVPAVVAVMTAEQVVAQQIGVQLVPATDDEESEETAGAEEEMDEDMEQQPPVVELGSELDLQGEAMGETPGTVRMTLDTTTYLATIKKWTDSEVSIKLPNLPVREPQAGSLKLFDAQGKQLSELEVIFVNKSN
jgi:hypothetical protein